MKKNINRVKRIVSVFIAAVIVLFPAAVPLPYSAASETAVKAYASSFSDISDTPFASAIEMLSNAAIINGYGDGTFGPYDTLTRAEACTLIYKAYGDDTYSPYSRYNFSDLPDSHWGYKYITYCAGAGIVSGYPDGTFRPNNSVTYDELISMLVRALKLNNGQILAWPTGYINAARQAGLLNGLSGVYIGNSNTSYANRGNTAIMMASSDFNTSAAADPDEDILADRDMTGVVYGIVTRTRSDLDSTGNGGIIASLLLGGWTYDAVPSPSLPYQFDNMTPATGLVRVAIENGRAVSVTKVNSSYSGAYGMMTPADNSSGLTAFSRIMSVSGNALNYNGSTSGSINISSNAVFYRIGMANGRLSAYAVDKSEISPGDMAAAYSVNGAAGTAAEILITIQPQDFDDVLHQSDNADFRLMG
ncbi:MAG: S-layer homology domain-containing protein [Eubacteriales bacterium]|nr:S-layer homology domain-containing protein [Eubacteriales bacterium]